MNSFQRALVTEKAALQRAKEDLQDALLTPGTSDETTQHLSSQVSSCLLTIQRLYDSRDEQAT